MLRGTEPFQKLDQARRQAYALASLILSFISLGYSTHDVLTQNWANLPSSFTTLLVGLSIVLAVYRWKVPTEKLSQGIAAGVLLVAVPEFAPDLQAQQVSVGHHLSFVLISALWFGLLPARHATLVTLVSYLAFATLVLSRPVHDPWLLIHLGSTVTVVGLVASYGLQVSHKRYEAAEFLQQAMTDVLTGLPNRRAVQSYIEELLESPSEASHRANQPFALIMLDIDYFKRVNDQYTHTVGDQVLRSTGTALRQLIGPDSVVGRWGGEEFMLVLPAQSAQQAYDSALKFHGQTIHLPGLPSICFSGGAVMSHEASSVAELLQLADLRLHTAKKSGRNQVKWNAYTVEPLSEDALEVPLAPSVPPKFH